MAAVPGDRASGPVTDQGSSLAVRALRLRYPSRDGGVLALDGIDLTIGAGELVCLVGPSGCGKTTLLQVLAGFVTATEGEVTVGGRPVRGPGADRGVVFQQSTSLYPWLSVRRNVELGLRLRRVPRAERRARAEAELSRVGLGDVADRAVYELSGGMQQRVQIARVLANDPDVMLMDEPFSALDALTREHLQSELRAIWQATGRTVVFVTHSVEEAVALGSRVIVLSSRPGRITRDEQLAFVRSSAPLAQIRSDPFFVAAAAAIRSAIEHPDTAEAAH